MTFTYKFVFIPLWLCLLAGQFVVTPHGSLPSPPLFVAGLVLAAIVFFVWLLPLKRVIATDSGLLVSNYRREVFVPYRQISSVSETRFPSRAITVELCSPTAFGMKVVFMPYSGPFLFDHPATNLLLHRAGIGLRRE